MSGTINFDGLCGIISLDATSDQQVRCKYKFGHDGPHSYENTETKGWFGGVFIHPVNLNSQDPNRNKPYCEECQNLIDLLNMAEEEIRRLKSSKNEKE